MRTNGDSEQSEVLTPGATVHVYLTEAGRVFLDYDAVVLDDDGNRVIHGREAIAFPTPPCPEGGEAFQ